MNPFPVELWAQILPDLDTQDLLAVSASCRPLSTIAQVYIYEEAKFDKISCNWEIEATANSRLARFARSLEERPDLAKHVRSLQLVSFGVSYPFASPDMYSTQSNPILVHLASFSTLRRLKLKGYHIDGDCYLAILGLTCLETLILDSCSTEKDLAQTALPPTARSIVLELSIVNTLSLYGWAAFAPFGLQSLTIGARRCPGDLVSNMILRNVNKSLTKLYLHFSTITPEVVSLLMCFPEILYLSFSGPFTSRDLERLEMSLSTSALPKLSHFAGPAEYVGIFVPGRPVHSVVVALEYDTPLESLDSLQFSSVPVTYMDFHRRRPSWTSKTFPIEMLKLSHVIFALHRLISRELVEEENISEWPQALSCMPTLRVLELHSCVRPKDFVEAIAAGCPSLQEVVYNKHDEAWIKLNDGRWERYLRYRSKSHV